MSLHNLHLKNDKILLIIKSLSQILNAKIKRMEHLLHLKDIRIEDLQARLEVSRPTGKR